ncbi:MAG: zinc ribbon domain-containing protein [Deltaproteobacteria bacterium]|nr:zinc ribbon domain-containing protein [Deltaproteobacteria bacterium]MBW1951076.1 zinc ribbon domain-containing protein [Deltaproteobacteria bacterium]MBW2009605.1 zinc ribbon domain-containing protein [Deltaproteobacteria bacterium]
MICPKCEFDNPETANFCGNCGATLTLRCAKCGHENPPRFNFCSQCGEAVGARPARPLTRGGHLWITLRRFSSRAYFNREKP